MSDLFGGSLPVPLKSQIAEVEREIAMRERLYPGWVRTGAMSPAAADRQLAAMCAVLATLRWLGA